MSRTRTRDADDAPVFSPAGDPDHPVAPLGWCSADCPRTPPSSPSTPLDAAREAPFAAAVHDVIVRDGCTSLIIVGALRLNVPGDDRLFHLGVAAPGAAPPAPLAPDFASLDARENVAVNDGVIAALVHAARAGGHPTTCAFVRGYRVPRVGAGDEAEAEAATTDALGRAVADGLGCGYASAGLEATRTWHEGRRRAETHGEDVHVRRGARRDEGRDEGS